MATNVIYLSRREKIAEAFARSPAYLPAEAAALVRQMLSPASIAIAIAAVDVWALSHLTGIGEFVDVLFLAVGAITLGFSVFSGARELLAVANGAAEATSSAGLDEAARHFARAVDILGLAAVQAILMKGPAKAAAERGMPRYGKPSFQVDEPPLAGEGLDVSRPDIVSGGRSFGVTDPYGRIEIARYINRGGQWEEVAISEQRITLYHELVHRYFSPRVGPLRKMRAQLSMNGYDRSAFLKYIEEALAEGYAQFRAQGLAEGFQAYKFPIEAGYVTVTQLQGEGVLIGTIFLSGAQFNVFVATREMRRP
jgi:hypothetical protein